jgi:hypothetical protein
MSQTMSRHPDFASLFAIIPETSILPLWALSDGVQRHPLCELIGDLVDPAPLVRETIRAMRLVNQNEPAWMNTLRSRLTSSDFTSAAGALGEIRGYGTLAEAGLFPKPLGQHTNPDFKVELAGDTIIVEVHTRQMDKAEREKLDAWAKVARAEVPNASVSVQFSPSISPFGEPDPGKPGDTVIANMISRITAIKAREHQLQAGGANVLWLDLRSGPTSMLINTSHALPFLSQAGRISTGALWAAMYGTRGLPLVEGRSHGRHVIVPMGHDGKFRGNPTKLSGVIAACCDGVVLLEHPNPIAALPPQFRNTLLMHMGFRAERSVCAWSNASEIVSRTLAIQEMSLRAIVENLKRSPFVYQDSYASPTRSSGREE